MKSSKILKRAVFAFLTLILLVSIAAAVSVRAQGDVTVSILDSIGGTTDPVAGTQTYNSGQTVTFLATPTSGYYLAFWTVVDPSGNITVYSTESIDLTLTTGNWSLQAVFQALNVPISAAVPSPNTSSEAVVIVLAAVGGTTTPGPGVYTLANAKSVNLKATAFTGWTFSHWVIGGYPLNHGVYSFTDTPTDNPYNVDHGYGYTYSYQPVFTLTSSSSSPTPTSSVPEVSFVALAVLFVLLFASIAVYTIKKRK